MESRQSGAVDYQKLRKRSPGTWRSGNSATPRARRSTSPSSASTGTSTRAGATSSRSSTRTTTATCGTSPIATSSCSPTGGPEFLRGPRPQEPRSRLPVPRARARALHRLHGHPQDSAPSSSRCSRRSARTRCTRGWRTARRWPSSRSGSTSGKVRRVRERIPSLKTVIVIDHEEDGRPLREGEVAFSMMDNRLETFPVFKAYPETPSVLHYTSGTTGKPKGAHARPRQHLRAVPDDEGRARSEGRRHLLVHGRPGLGDRHELRHHRAVGAGRDAGRGGRRLLERSLVRDDREAPRDRLVHGADRDPHAHEGRPRPGEAPRSLDACATCAASASR